MENALQSLLNIKMLLLLSMPTLYLIIFYILLYRSEVNKNTAKILESIKPSQELLTLDVDAKTVFYMELVIGVIFSIISIMITYLSMLSNFELSKFTLISSILLIISTQTGVATLTDGIGHEIDRFISRVGYIFTGIICIVYLYSYVPPVYRKWMLIALIGLQLLTIILLLFTNSMGPADFRVLLLTNFVAVIIARNYTVYFILLELLLAATYQFIIQKRAGDKKLPVPIGHVLLLVSLILTIVMKTV